MAMQAEWLEKDYYDVLGVPETASAKEVTRAYRKLARELHPDTHPGDAAAEERFKEVSAGYDVIGDAAKRKEYDEVRRLGPMAAGPAPGAGGGGSGRFGFRVEDLGDLGDLEDLFGADLLGSLFGSGGTGRFAAGPAAGLDFGAGLALGFEDAVHGTTVTLTVPEAGDAPPREVKVRVPAGVEDGQTIRVAGKGGPGRDGGPPGDLYVTVRVGPHRLFGRQGRNLTVTVPITFPEAVLGADVKVPSLEGDPVTLRVPPGTPSGRTFRVRGRGVAATGGRGDLLVTVEVAVPGRASPAQRAALEAFAEASPGSPRRHLGV